MESTQLWVVPPGGQDNPPQAGQPTAGPSHLSTSAVGAKDRAALTAFLDHHAARMPRTMLSYAIEHFSPAEKARYRALRRQA